MDLGFNSGQGQEVFSFLKFSICGTYQTCYHVIGGCCFPGGKAVRT
jgi:hypothetical protein